LTENRGVLQSVKTIFVGGGTPSALSESELEQLLAMISDNVGSSFIEWTMESNPESLSTAKIELMHKYGVNRVSMGVQSFNEVTRKNIGRVGSVLMVDKAVSELNRVGITNINFDLIFGSKGQTSKMWLEDLEMACSFPISHLSTYSLSIEPGSVLEKDAIEIDEDLAVDFMEQTSETLESKGFNRYEISNFSKAGYCCQHNNGVWHGETYLGLGPAAASFDGKDRWQEETEISNWLSGANVEKDIVSIYERAREVFVIGLRTIEGWDLDDFLAKTGVPITNLYSEEIANLVQRGFLIHDGNRIYSTPQGLLYADYIAVDLI
jgi:oxygen-independent coproporphyrinogen-3 oxidase